MKTFPTVTVVNFATNSTPKMDRGSGRVVSVHRGSGRLKANQIKALRALKSDRGSGRIAA